MRKKRAGGEKPRYAVSAFTGLHFRRRSSFEKEATFLSCEGIRGRSSRSRDVEKKR